MRISLPTYFILLATAGLLNAMPVRAAEGDKAPPAATADAKPAEVEKEKPKEAEGGEKKKSGGGDDVSGGRFAGDPVYVHIMPLVLPVISNEGVEQLITILIDVEVKDFDVADNMHTNMPRVRDALMRALYGGLGQGSLREGKLVDVNKVKAKATTALNEVVGGNGIREVLVQGIAQRML